MNSTNKYHIDHIDPKFEEGRDYQKVCGLDCDLNFEERDPTLNMSKNNRFLPWRVAKGEIGVVPVEQGDWCQFLDLDTGEWVLADFLGEWWFEMSKRTKGTVNMSEESRARSLAACNSPEARLKRIQTLTGKKHSKETKEKQRVAKLGIKLSPEHIEKVVRTRKSNGNPWHSPETIEKQRAKATGQKQSPEVVARRVSTRKATLKRKEELARMRSRSMSDPQFPFFDDDD